MKSKQIIFVIVILVTGVVHADNDIVSKAYVDNMTQEKIATSGTVGNIMVYNGTNANTGQTQFTEIGTYNGATTYNSTNDSGKLATASVAAGFAATVESATIPDTTLVCANAPECSLWTKPAANATRSLVVAGTFAPLTAP